MNDELIKIQKDVETFYLEIADEIIPLYPGIKICYRTFSSGSSSVQHKAMSHIIQINYCKTGQIVWEMKNGNRIYLNPGDFSLHTMKACTDSVLTFPNGIYQGLSIYIDLQEVSDHPPELLKGSNIFETILPEKFCRNDSPVFLAGNEQTESIFSAFFNQPESLKLPYQKIKTMELLLYLSKTELNSSQQLYEYKTEQLHIIREIHDKSIYGTSIAAHIKEHRMEQAAKMLKETDKSIAEIARAVGYDSQSRFTAAFKTYFKVLPKEYRKK